MVYGPYWDMYDKEKYDICPFQNDEVKCNPSAIPGCMDYFNHHVRLQHAYLDEERLLKEDIPEELPFAVELEDGIVTNDRLCNFVGEACYYIVSEFEAYEEHPEVVFGLSRNTPCKVWLDGRLCFEYSKYTCWAPEGDWGVTFKLTGKRQRVVVKVASEVEAFKISWGFSQMVSQRKRAVSPSCSVRSWCITNR